MKIIIIEIQKFTDGSVGTLCYSYDDRNTAEQKYHEILSYAAVSTLPRHTACMIMDNGRLIKSESYDHPVESESESEA